MADFTVVFDKIEDMIVVPAVIGYNGNYKQVRALFDTGATITYITEEFVKELNLPTTGERIKTKALKTIQEGLVIKANIGFPKDNVFSNWSAVSMIRDNPNFDIIIGMDIIKRGDFAISNQNGHTIFTFRVPSESEIRFTDNSVSEQDIPALIKMMKHL